MADESTADKAVTYRATSGIVTMIGAGLLAIFLLGDAVVRDSWGTMLLLAPWVLLALWIIYELTTASIVRANRSGIYVRNFLRYTTAGWNQVDELDMHWQLEVVFLDDTRVACMGGPMRARMNQPRASKDAKEPSLPAGLREFSEIRALWEDASGPDADAPVRRGWDTRALGIIGGIAVWAGIAILLTM
ncbi:PH domain-containing protein [Microbacterium sp. YY-01]|uniref:PH domain-containing protein n=1 Tax=Microbacterium sp. YY-01 TaxID=3421634 RepID=UPI003D172CAE